MDGYLAKPIDRELLYQAVEEDEQATVEREESPVATPSAAMDMTALLDRLGGDMALTADVIAVFLEDGPGRVTAIGDAVSDLDAGRLRTAAHALKGAAGNVGATPLFEAARRLEQIGATGDLSGVDTAWRELEDEAGRVISGMRQWSALHSGRIETCAP